MNQTSLPTLQELVTITSGVSETLFGIPLQHDRTAESPGNGKAWRSEALVLSAEHPLKVVVSLQDDNLEHFSRSFLEEGGRPEGLQNDVLGEMVNLVAGQIKAVLAVDYAMGLPYAETVAVGREGEKICSAWLCSHDGKIKLWTAVIEGD